MLFLIVFYLFTHGVVAKESDNMSDLFKNFRQKYPYGDGEPAIESLNTPTESYQDINQILKNFLIKSENEEKNIDNDNEPRAKEMKSVVNKGRQISTSQENVPPNTNGKAGFVDWIKKKFDDLTSDTNQKPIPDNTVKSNKTDEQHVSSLPNVLDRMATALEKINDNLASIKDSGFYILKVPPVRSQAQYRKKNKLRRGKRAIEPDNIYKNNSKETLPLESVKNIAVENDTSTEKNNLNNKTNDATNSRRLMNYAASTNSVKLKLLNYINESFTEIQNKINTLHLVKQGFAENTVYKIGYIVSNIDTLEVNMKNLKRDMEINKNMWDDKVILDLFDKLKTTNKVISDLLDLLKTYVSKSTQHQIRRALLPQSQL